VVHDEEAALMVATVKLDQISCDGGEAGGGGHRHHEGPVVIHEEKVFA
jgi:hypothetical protein